MSKKFYPNGDRYLVQQSEVVTKTSSGLFVPETSAEAPAEGIIVSIGNFLVPKDQQVEQSFQLGDKVSFGRYSGVQINLDSQIYLILKQEEILGSITED